ncbi:hypothetical protein, partial [Alistipes putredinis]|uniref:hypothetical protein n=1 Tax=Alistipes putredinis TaxID=28117 RepID=UPI003FD77772
SDRREVARKIHNLIGPGNCEAVNYRSFIYNSRFLHPAKAESFRSSPLKTFIKNTVTYQDG